MPLFKDYARYYGLIYAKKDYKKEAAFVYNWAGKPKTIFEIGCGLGKHAQYWCNRTQVTAIDQSSEMLKYAFRHKNIKYSTKKLKWFSHNSFDCIMALFNVMGYCLLEESLPLLPLKKGGYFVFDIWDADKMRQCPPIPKIKHLGLSYRVAVPEQISKRLVRIDYVIVEGREIKAFERHFVQGYFREDIEQLCKLHGFEIAGVKPTKGWSCWYKLRKEK